MATFGIEGIRYFSHLRSATGRTVGDLTYVFNICNGFSATLRQAGHSKNFYLANANCREQDLTEPADASSADRFYFADSVDLYLVYTHGSNGAGKSMLFFDSELRSWTATSDAWNLGNASLNWLFIYGCHTVDRTSVTSLLNVFDGLHAFCGAWGNMYDGWTVDDVGEDVAEHLTQGHTVREAWLDGVSDWWFDNHPIVVCAEVEATYNGGAIRWEETTMYNDRVPSAQVNSVSPITAFWLSRWWAEG